MLTTVVLCAIILDMLKQTTNRENEMTQTITQEQSIEIERQYNVCIDIETMQYNNESHDAETGWMPMPSTSKPGILMEG